MLNKEIEWVMLNYYHGTDGASLNAILTSGADITKGGGEIGMGFYVGSSLWRAFSWAWHKANKNKVPSYGVIAYQIDEMNFLSLSILCKNRQSTKSTYTNLKKKHSEKTWTSGHDAIWAPVVGDNIQDTYQIKFESDQGKTFINKQNKKKLWP